MAARWQLATRTMPPTASMRRIKPSSSWSTRRTKRRTHRRHGVSRHICVVVAPRGAAPAPPASVDRRTCTRARTPPPLVRRDTSSLPRGGPRTRGWEDARVVVLPRTPAMGVADGLEGHATPAGAEHPHRHGRRAWRALKSHAVHHLTVELRCRVDAGNGALLRSGQPLDDVVPEARLDDVGDASDVEPGHGGLERLGEGAGLERSEISPLVRAPSSS